MKIAIVAPIEETIPPQFYGGIEWITYYVADGMGKKGHEVDLYAAGNSPTSETYKLIPTVEKSIRTVEKFKEPQIRGAEKFLSYAQTAQQISEGNYDIVHNHASWRFLIFAPFIKAPIVTTHHGPLSPPYQQLIFERYKDYPYVSISKNQEKDMPTLNYAATVYNGIDLSKFAHDDNLIPGTDAKLMFLARMSPEKGGIEAAEAAHRAGKNLFVASKVDAVDEEFFKKFKESIVGKTTTFEGEISHTARVSYLQNSRALLAPIQWEEPFGLMFTEAMACGTPVIAYARGAAPEIIVDGVTGFLVNESDKYIRGDWIIKKTGIDGLVEAINRVYTLPDDQYRQMRKKSREHVEQKFGVQHMVDGYESVYQSVLSKR